MKIHTNLTSAEMIHLAYGIDGVYVELTERGSRSRPRAFDLHLLAEHRQGRRRGNTGHYGAGYDYAATWDEWGIVFARLFALDPDAICGTGSYAVYHGAADYHFKTARRFQKFGELVYIDAERWVFPEIGQIHFNAHDQHRWSYNRAQSEQDAEELDRSIAGRTDQSQVNTSWCTKCGALRRFVWTPKAVAA
jgi:hypothetical protein